MLNGHAFVVAPPARDRIAGTGEAIEVAPIRDAAFFRRLERRTDDLTSIERRVQPPMRPIGFGGDPSESGGAPDARYSIVPGPLATGAEERVCRPPGCPGLRSRHSAPEADGAAGGHEPPGGPGDFREHVGGEPTLASPDGIGTGPGVHGMDAAAIARRIEWSSGRTGSEPDGAVGETRDGLERA